MTSSCVAVAWLPGAAFKLDDSVLSHKGNTLTIQLQHPKSDNRQLKCFSNKTCVTFTDKCGSAYLNLPPYVHQNACTYTYEFTCTYLCMYTYIYIYIYICVCMCVYKLVASSHRPSSLYNIDSFIRKFFQRWRWEVHALESYKLWYYLCKW